MPELHTVPAFSRFAAFFDPSTKKSRWRMGKKWGGGNVGNSGHRSCCQSKTLFVFKHIWLACSKSCQNMFIVIFHQFLRKSDTHRIFITRSTSLAVLVKLFWIGASSSHTPGARAGWPYEYCRLELRLWFGSDWIVAEACIWLCAFLR